MDLEDLARKPVFDLGTERFLGYVLGTVVDADRRSLLGILTRTRFGRPKMVAPMASVVLMHREGVMIEKTGFRWLPLSPALWRLARRHRKQPVPEAVHEGETIGSVVDYSVDAEGNITHVIVQRGMIGKTRRVRREKVTAVEDGRMILAADALDSAKTKRKAHSSAGLVEGAAALLGRTVAKATHRVKSEARSSLLGKASPWNVETEEGLVLAPEGAPLTEEALAAVARRGKLGELAAAVAAGGLGRAVAKRRKKNMRRQNP